MSEMSKQVHSIIIGDRNTWDDWHLAPETRPVINPPEVNNEYIEIPGADGALDYTEALAGRPVYKNRTGSWNFIVMNGYQEWYQLYDQLLAYLHGHEFDVILEDEPIYKYHGRLSINEWRSEEHNSKIVIDYVLEPYKKLVEGAVSDWLWDDLTFNSDAYIIYYGTFDVNGIRNRILWNPTNDVIHPDITVTDLINVTCLDETYAFLKGTTKESSLELFPGANLVTFTGTGQVTINYDRGDTI